MFSDREALGHVWSQHDLENQDNFFSPHSAVGRWKPAVFFFPGGNQREKHVELRTAPSFQPLTRRAHKALVVSHRRPAAAVGHTPGQEGIMPLFLLRSAMLRRLWLDTRLLLASFLRRSRKVSRVWPWPFGFPTTLLGRSGRTLQGGHTGELPITFHRGAIERFISMFCRWFVHNPQKSHFFFLILKIIFFIVFELIFSLFL